MKNDPADILVELNSFALTCQCGSKKISIRTKNGENGSVDFYLICGICDNEEFLFNFAQ